MSDNKKNSNNFSRRQFLRGLGGATLYLPFLPSLLSKEAFAAALSAPVARRFVGMMSANGALSFSNWYPSKTPTRSVALYSDHNIRWDSLTSLMSNNRLSPVLGSAFTPALLSKMNLFRGLDILQYLGHYSSVLGNFYANDNGHTGFVAMPTIDQIMAYSNKFYPSTPSGPRSIVLRSKDGKVISHNYSRPGDKSSAIQSASSYNDPVAVYNAIFPNGSSSGSSTPSASMVLTRKVTNDVYDDYRRLAQSSQIGAEDKQTLEGHMNMLSELEKRLENYGASTCSSQAPAGGSSFDQGVRYQLMNDVIAAAFKCGLSRIATQRVDQLLGVTSAGGQPWHNWSHSSNQSSSQSNLVKLNTIVAEKVFLDLVKKLDVIEDPVTGSTYLDNSLIVWVQEASSTHTTTSIPVITAGSAGGRLNTGRMIDYRNIAKGSFTDVENPNAYEGVAYNRFLVTCLQAMGLSQPDYQIKGMPGYGDTKFLGYTSFVDARRNRYRNELANINKPLELFYKG